jgi:hypothetical protein
LASPDKKAFLLRLPPDVWAQLERLAASELRSVDGQVEYLLREGSRGASTPPLPKKRPPAKREDKPAQIAQQPRGG